ncbi:MAG TPA: lipid II flippase MurJ, partial [Egibacteraceae bacterium]|nr:lipid II flippase MurJ [Egibacteraceae bacterium]
MAEPDQPAGSSRDGSTLVAAGIFLSRISGLVRERAIAHFLGTTFATDAFRAAMRIPNMLQNLLGEGVLSASFIPVYSKLLAEGRDRDAGVVAGAIAGLLTALTGALVVVGMLFAEPITAVIAAGFTGQRFDLTVTLVRIVTPGIGFLVLSAWCLGVLNSHRHFFLSYVAPVVLNAVQIAVLIGFGLTVFRGGLGGDATQPEALAGLATALGWGTLAGGVLQLAVQVPKVVRLVPGLRPSLRTDDPGVRRTIRAFGPVVAGRGVVQLSAYVDTLLASFLVAGALAALGYAQMLYLLPISLFGMSVAAAELPELSSATDEDRAGLS